MSLLITETSQEVELWESKSKTPYIVGIFSSAEVKNSNGRRYGKDILEREVSRFNKEKVRTKSSWGELEHPEGPSINLAEVAILIEELQWKGTDVYGKARILDTPKGKILQELVKVGNVGISSRGLGTVSESGFVNTDYNLLAYDAVCDASNPSSRFVNGILEGVSFGKEIEITMAEAQDAIFEYQMDMINNILG